MRKTWAIYMKEMQYYFASPMAYVVITIFLAISGYFFLMMTLNFNKVCMDAARYPTEYLKYINVNEMVFKPFFYNSGLIILLICPLLTMRIYSEEQKLGTMELLATSPLTKTNIILGKYLAALSVFLLMLFITFLYVLLLSFYGEIAWTQLFINYLGVIFIGSFFIALGNMVSSFTENQLISAVFTFGLSLILWIISWTSQLGDNTLLTVLGYISPLEHYHNFMKGVIDTKDIFYFISFIFSTLVITGVSLDSIRWRE